MNKITATQESEVSQMKAGNKVNQAELEATMRVLRFMNAVADLRSGDLRFVLRLDEIVPMEEDGPATRQTDQAGTGEGLAIILEDRLLTILAIGEHSLDCIERATESHELGRRRFATSQGLNPS
jgi:hypothetical protein